MSWTAKTLVTLDDGKIISESDYTALRDNFKIKHSLGDEMISESGNMAIVHKNTLHPGFWLAMYWNDELYEAYKIQSPYDSQDEKTKKYKTTLKPLQKIFADDCAETVIEYSADPEDWSYDIGNASVKISQIEVYGSGALHWPYSYVYGFHLAELIRYMQGNNGNSYKIGSITHDSAPIIGENNAPLIYRGQSKFWVDTLENAVNWTFLDFSTTWLDIIKLNMYAYNTYLRALPSITNIGGDDYLTVDIELIPRINGSAASPLTLKWLERTITPERYKINGVSIQSTILDEESNPSFSYEQGDIQREHIFSRSINIGDPETNIMNPDDILYWSEGSVTEYYSFYDIATPGYFASGLVEQFYEDLIGSGNGAGWKGKIRFQGEKIGDVVYGGTDIMRILKISPDNKNNAGIEGIKIA